MKVIDVSELAHSDACVFSVIAINQYWKNHAKYSFAKDSPRVQNGFTLILCREATYTEDGKETLRAPRGSLVCVPAGSSYSVEFLVDGEEAPTSLIVNFSLRDENGGLPSLGNSPTLLASDGDGQLQARFSRLVEKSRGMSVPSVKAAFYSLLSLIASGDTGRCDESLAEITEYVERNIGKGVTVESLGRRFALSESTLRRRFKETLGISPVDYINRVKIERAKVLLGADEVTCETVCEQLGFYDPSHFYKVFRKYTGMTPNEWKRRGF